MYSTASFSLASLATYNGTLLIVTKNGWLLYYSFCKNMAIPIMNPLLRFMIMGKQITTIFPRKVTKGYKTHYA